MGGEGRGEKGRGGGEEGGLEGPLCEILSTPLLDIIAGFLPRHWLLRFSQFHS